MQESAVPILVVQEGQLAGKRWPLNKTEFLIGRGEDCDIVLPDRQVSRHHFRVVRDNNGYNVEDLGSKNGTYINGAPVRGSMQLQDGDEIQVALSVRLLFVGAEATLPLTQEMLRVAQPGLRLNKSQRHVWVNGAALDPPLSLSQYRLLEILLLVLVILKITKIEVINSKRRGSNFSSCSTSQTPPYPPSETTSQTSLNTMSAQ